MKGGDSLVKDLVAYWIRAISLVCFILLKLYYPNKLADLYSNQLYILVVLHAQNI